MSGHPVSSTSEHMILIVTFEMFNTAGSNAERLEVTVP